MAKSAGLIVFVPDLLAGFINGNYTQADPLTMAEVEDSTCTMRQKFKEGIETLIARKWPDNFRIPDCR